jgi:hypothetical protein
LTGTTHDANQLSTAQAAQVLGLSEEAIKSRLLRARLALREKLSAYMAGRAFEGSVRGDGEIALSTPLFKSAVPVTSIYPAARTVTSRLG